jgi:hypothetical protein
MSSYPGRITAVTRSRRFTSPSRSACTCHVLDHLRRSCGTSAEAWEHSQAKPVSDPADSAPRDPKGTGRRYAGTDPRPADHE